MLRCDQSAGKFHVEFTMLRAKEEVRVGIMSHVAVWADLPQGGRTMVEDAPSVSTEHPYEGELCEHELAWINADPPAYRLDYLFKVTPLE